MTQLTTDTAGLQAMAAASRPRPAAGARTCSTAWYATSSSTFVSSRPVSIDPTVFDDHKHGTRPPSDPSP